MSEAKSPSVNEVDLQRWRLILGRFAEQQLGQCGARESRMARMDRVLDYLYGREYRGRGVRGVDGRGSASRGDSRDIDSRLGGDAASLLSVPEWIREVRELFPNDTAEIIQRHALDRYGMTELVTEIPLCFSISIQSDLANLPDFFPFTVPAWRIAPPNNNNCSVMVVLPASGWEMMAKVLLAFTLSANV